MQLSFLVKFTGFLLILFLLPLNAATSLQFSESFNIKAINGNLYSSGLFYDSRSINLNAGLNLIALEYEEVFENQDNDNFDIVKSEVFLLRVYLKGNQQYQQRVVKPINASAARSYMLRPIFEIINLTESNQPALRYELTALASSSDSFLIAKTRIKNNRSISLSSNNQSKNIFKFEQPIIKATNKPSQKSSTSSQTLQMLHYWWQQATPAEREIFLDSIKSNQ